MLSLLTLVLSTTAAAPPPIMPDFSPHPYEETVKLQNGKVHVTERFRGCGTSFTTDKPAFTFTLPKEMKDLRVWFNNGFAVLVMPVPGKPHVCVKQQVAFFSDWPAGTYEVYLMGSSVGLGADIRIEMPKRALAEAKAAASSTPDIPITGEERENPSYHLLPATSVHRAELTALRCGKEGQMVMPIARLQMKKASKYTVVASGKRGLILAGKDGTCAPRFDDGSFKLEAKDYELWGLVGSRSEEPWEIEISDEERALLFAEAPTISLADLGTPLAIGAKIATSKWGPSRRNACQGPRAPSFYLKSEGLANVVLSVLRGPEKVKFNVYGPLETAKPFSSMSCDNERSAIFNPAKGTWAVWLVGDEHAGQEVHALAKRLELRPDVMATPIEIPAELSVEERVYSQHYPFYKKAGVERLFLEAPDQLFVFVDDEPLLLASQKGDEAEVVHFDGKRTKVAAASVTTTRPSTGKLPKKPPPLESAKTLERALSLAGPGEKKLVDGYEKKEDKYRSCVYAFMKKNDPSWGKKYDLIYVATGENVSDVMFKKADKSCARNALDAAGKKLIKQINSSRKKTAKKYLADVTKRFAK